MLPGWGRPSYAHPRCVPPPALRARGRVRYRRPGSRPAGRPGTRKRGALPDSRRRKTEDRTPLRGAFRTWQPCDEPRTTHPARRRSARQQWREHPPPPAPCVPTAPDRCRSRPLRLRTARPLHAHRHLHPRPAHVPDSGLPQSQSRHPTRRRNRRRSHPGGRGTQRRCCPARECRCHLSRPQNHHSGGPAGYRGQNQRGSPLAARGNAPPLPP